MAQEIVLFEHQKAHCQRVLDILTGANFEPFTEFHTTGSYVYIDGTTQGNGKTIVVLNTAKTLGLKLVVACYEIAKDFWITEANKYGVEVARDSTGGLAVYTYESIRTTKGRQPKNGFLNRTDSQNDGTSFVATDEYIALVEEGIILVLDECHKLKNKTNQADACRQLIYPIQVRETRSKVACVSGTIIDKDIVNFTKVIGIVENAPLKKGKKRDLQTEEEIHVFGKKVNPAAHLDFVMARNRPTDYFVSYFNKVIKPKIMSTMEVNEELHRNAKLNVYNGYFPMTSEKRREYEDAIAELSSAVRFNPQQNTGFRNNNLGAVVLTTKKIQVSKKEIIDHLVKSTFDVTYYNEKGQQSWPKICIYANYFEVIDYWLKELEAYHPLEITGRTTRDRNKYVKMFQENNSNHRLIISNPSVGATSISLNDRDPEGRYPRIFLVFKDFNTINGQQLMYRGYRVGTFGVSTVIFVYGDTEDQVTGTEPRVRETTIDNAVNRKSKTLSSIHEEQKGIFIHDIPDKTLPIGPIEIEGYSFRSLDLDLDLLAL